MADVENARPSRLSADEMKTLAFESPLEETIHSCDEKHDGKHPQTDSSSSLDNVDNDIPDSDEITWHYLTFETDLPEPAYLQKESPDEQSSNPPPPCPDLAKYMSPFLWSSKRKSVMVWISSFATGFTAYNAGAYTSGLDQMRQLWHVSEVVGLLGVTVFVVGFGITPMILAPFSEITGRQPVFLLSGVFWVLFQIVCAVTPTFAGMLIARFFSGAFSSTFATMVGGILADIYSAKDRNTPMTIYSGFVMMGTGLGPLISSFLAYHTNWRWIFYLQIITDGIVVVFILFFFKETRGSVLLSRKAKALNKWYDQLEAEGYYGVVVPSASDPHKTSVQRIRWKCAADEERSSFGKIIAISLYRPFHMLFTEPVVFFFSLWVAFAWGLLYMTFNAIPLIFETTFHFNLEESGGVFAAVTIAGLLWTPIFIYQDKIGMKFLPGSQKRILQSPEGRLYFTSVWAAFLPLGILWFGISGAYESAHWITPTLGIACATVGIFAVYLAVFNYLADSYGKYASSALAAQSFCRQMMAGGFPLFTNQMFKALTYQGAGGLLAGIGFVLTIVPWVLLLYGPKIRAKSRLAGEALK